MSVHQCPKCELRFSYKTELDDHCWHDHPQFRHEYPASAPPVVEAPAVVPTPATPAVHEHVPFIDTLTAWTHPRARRGGPVR